jgi:hypothetical protein
LKALLALSILTGVLSAGLLLWWDAADGTRFARAFEDLSSLSSDDLKRHPVTDPWGNPYLQVEAHSTGRAVTCIISQGPDGRSDTLGHDSDDITNWKSRFEWLGDRHRTRRVLSVLLISGTVSLALGSMIAVRTQSREIPSPTSLGIRRRQAVNLNPRFHPAADAL